MSFFSDDNECAEDEENPEYIGPCGENTVCFNTIGSFYCQCQEGFISSTNTKNFSANSSATCQGKLSCVFI